MKRRSDRGEFDAWDRRAVALLTLAHFVVILALFHRTDTDLKRIADAVAVYAPPAEPVAVTPQHPLVGRTAVLRGTAPGEYAIAHITGVRTEPSVGIVTPWVEYSGYFIVGAKCRTGGGGCAMSVFRKRLIGFAGEARAGLALVGVEMSAKPAEEGPDGE